MSDVWGETMLTHAAKAGVSDQESVGLEYALVGWGEYASVLFPEEYAAYCAAYDRAFVEALARQLAAEQHWSGAQLQEVR